MDIGASNWNESDDNNSTAAPNGAPEGMPPSGVNNTVRAVMGSIKRWYDWSIPKVTGGTSTAYTLTYGVAPGALVDGMMHLIQFHAGNGISATLNVNGLGAKPLYYYAVGGWYQAPPALVGVDMVCRVTYHAGTGAYRIIRDQGGVPTGTPLPFGGTTAPAGYLLCFGQAISRTDYAGLFAAVGTVHGAGNGSTTFNVPDLRGRVAAGKDDMGGSSASRLSSVISSTVLGYRGRCPNSRYITSAAALAVLALARRWSYAMDGARSHLVLADGPTLGAHGSHSHSQRSEHRVGHSWGQYFWWHRYGVGVVQPTIILNYIIAI